MNVLQLNKTLTEPPKLHSPTVPVGSDETIRIRTYRGAQDIAVWLELRHRAFAREKLGVRQWDGTDFQREFLAKPWWRPERMWFAERVAGEAIGTVTLAMRGEAAQAKPVVHWLAVLPSQRRRGIGRQLMLTLEAACWDAGYRQVWLETHAAWSAAATLYETLGYRSLE